jgi:aspartate-semialdehyde dehydrogenase
MQKKFKVCVAGATGRIGTDIVNLLAERKFPVSQVTPLSSFNSAGVPVFFGDKKLHAIDTEDYDFKGDEIIFFALDDESTKKYLPRALKNSRGIIIDNSSIFRMEKNVALVTSGVNDEDIESGSRIISNPNCCVIPLTILLDAIRKNSDLKIRRVEVTSFQSVSGAGTKAMNELFTQTKSKFGAPFTEDEKNRVFEKQITFNCIPKIGSFMNDGYSTEEWKVMNEPKKILHAPNLLINATCVRVPVFVGHSQVVNIEFTNDSPKVDYSEIYDIINSHELIEIYDNFQGNYHTPIECIKSDEVLISRLRIDPTVRNGITLWMVSDNLHLGGALNAVKIAEKIVSVEDESVHKDNNDELNQEY